MHSSIMFVSLFASQYLFSLVTYQIERSTSFRIHRVVIVLIVVVTGNALVISAYVAIYVSICTEGGHFNVMPRTAGTRY